MYFLSACEPLPLAAGLPFDVHVETLVRTESSLGKMENLAHNDLLTGLGNRVALDQFLKQDKTSGNSLSFLYLDLDGFKIINDTLIVRQGRKRSLQGFGQ